MDLITTHLLYLWRVPERKEGVQGASDTRPTQGTQGTQGTQDAPEMITAQPRPAPTCEWISYA